ncbi:MAG: glycosyltransferase [Pseudomonadaceae bacterium]|nr:glycosyltransferase [Pseudomonadaceae bacterium]
MRILHVVRQFAPSVGGLEAYVASLAQHQQQAGHQVAVLTLNRLFMARTEEKLSAHETVDGIPVRRIGFTGTRRLFVPHISPSMLKGYDIIHVHNTDGFFDTLALLRPFLKAKLVATTHGGFFHTPDFGLFKRIWFNCITRLTIRAYAHMFAISGNDFATFHQMMPRLSLQPNAVTPMAPTLCSGEDFLYVGRLAPHKNLPGLLQTYAELRKRGINGTLHIVGSPWGVAVEDLQSLAKSLRIASHVRLHGHLDGAALAKRATTCGFFVSASRFEGFGMSMLEAMGAGLVPLVHANASFAELLDTANLGVCTDMESPVAAAERIAAYLPTVTGFTRQQAQAFAARYNWPALTAATLAVYQSLLNGKTSA